jgi:uncharacterized protein involved in response to NO
MARALPLQGQPRPATPVALPLLAKGFRPFFLMAGLFAAAMVPIWVLVQLGVAQPGAYFDATFWHAHEMIFGYAAAVIAGFLLTAVGNWTERETAVGLPLLGLCALWLAGRVAVTFPQLLPAAATAAIDVAFLPALAVVLARPLVAAGNRRNFVMLGVLAALAAANVAMHLDVLGALPGWRRRAALGALDVVVVLLLVMAGRVFPMFTRNATRSATIRSVPALDALAIGSMAALTVGDVAIPDRRALLGALAAVAGVLAAARAAHWGTASTARHPLLWILHVGYAWIPAGLLLRAVAAATDRVPSTLATHALTVGAIGALTLGMMARVALGHTGRMLEAPRPAAAGFALVTLSALIRVVGPLAFPTHYLATVVIAGLAFGVAFALFAASYGRLLASPRVDGKSG